MFPMATFCESDATAFMKQTRTLRTGDREMSSRNGATVMVFGRETQESETCGLVDLGLQRFVSTLTRAA